MIIYYLIGVPATVLALIVATRLEKSPNGDDPGWLILLMSFLWPLTVPILLFLLTTHLIDLSVKGTAKKSEAPVNPEPPTTCRRCSTPLPCKGKFCPHCGKLRTH